MINYLKVKKDLYFVEQNIKPEAQKQKVVEVNTHHIFVIDCSGSMSYELNAIRKDLFNKISTLLKKKDSTSILWFSGKDEFGVLLDDWTVDSPMSLEKVRETINKHLTPQGLTAFKQPLEEVKRVVERVAKAKKDYLHSLFFLTDGCDNCWDRKDIIKAVASIKDSLNSATIVEYGWYCNRELMSNMAQTLGGVHTVSQHFSDYEPYVAKQFSNDTKGKRKYIQLEEAPAFGAVFNTVDQDVILYETNENNEVLIGVDGEVNLYYFTTKVPQGKLLGDSDYIHKAYTDNSYKTLSVIQGLYSSLFAFSRKSDFNIVSEVLKFLGDANLILIKANTFGTQKITELEQKFVDAVNDANFRYIQGYNPDLEPAEDAYCVLDMIADLINDEENNWYPQHDAFGYKRIGSKAVAKKREVSDDDKAKLENLLKEGKLEDLQDALSEVKDNQIPELKFHYDNALQPCSFGSLTWNEERANLSVLVTFPGYVELPANKFGLETKFPTKITRNYTIIKDGIVHSYNLPVSLSKATFALLQKQGLLKGETFTKGKIYVLNFEELPVINRKMVESLSAKDVFTNSYELLKLQASNTVYTAIKKRLFKNVDKSFKDIYGEEATKWLESMGLKSYGFSPLKTIEKSGEEIIVNTMTIKIDKLSTSMAAKDVEATEKKVDAGEEVTGRQTLLVPAIKEYKKFVAGLKDPNDLQSIQDWLYAKSQGQRSVKSRLMTEISKSKFLTIVGKSWFKEFTDRSQKEMTLNLDSQDIKFIVDDKLSTIKL